MMRRQRNTLVIGVVLVGVILAVIGLMVLIGNTDEGNITKSEDQTRQFQNTATAIAAQATTLAPTGDAGQGDDPTAVSDGGGTATIPPPNVLPSPPPEEGQEPQAGGGGGGEHVASVDFTIISEAGERLGDGTVRLYSPIQMHLNESAEVVVELDLSLQPGVTLTALPIPPTFTPTPRPSRTPMSGTPRPTRTPPPLQGEGYVPVHEFMGAELLGVDRHNFRIEAVPADGLLHIQPNGINRWRWSIRPIDADAVGINRLEIQIYLPLRRSDDTAFREETNLLPFEIEVLPDGASTKADDDEGGGWLGVIAGVGGLAVLSGLGYGGYWWVQRRRKSLRIFISYRRSDSQGSAGRLYDRLSQTFGKSLVFRDVEDIEYGADFVNAIDQAVGACEVLIAVIGSQWLNARDSAGKRRLDNPHDFVRLEIATALRRGIRVIPALVDDARMPAEADLPDDLQELHRRNAIAVRNDAFDDDVERLVRSLLE